MLSPLEKVKGHVVMSEINHGFRLLLSTSATQPPSERDLGSLIWTPAIMLLYQECTQGAAHAYQRPGARDTQLYYVSLLLYVKSFSVCSRFIFLFANYMKRFWYLVERCTSFDIVSLMVKPAIYQIVK